jgi:hypothetical protein
MVVEGEAALRVQDIRVVCDFADVFPTELPGIPLERDATFEIKLIPGTQPIHKASYQMAPKEQVKLKRQLDDLLAKVSLGLADHHGLPQYCLLRRRIKARGYVWIIVL